MENYIINYIMIFLVSFVSGLIARNFLPAYFSEKGKNLATKEDIAKITEQVKKVENTFLEKAELGKVERNFYYEMIDVIYKFLAQIKKFEHQEGKSLTKDIVKKENKYNNEYQNFIDDANRILGQAFVFLKEENYVLLRDAIKTEFSVNELANNLLSAMRKSIYKDTKLNAGDLRELKY
jgi:hypothetical protein